MTNAVGFYYKEREERLSSKAKNSGGQFISSVDINRDFPYNHNNPSECLNSVASRIIYQIFAKNDIYASLTFHGGDNVIGYPWGSWNHSHKKGG